MPRPVSVTISRASDSVRSSLTVTCPPRGVNLIALLSRFQTTCWRRTGSPLTRPAPSSCSRSLMPLASAAGRTESMASWATGGQVDGLDVQPELAGDDPADVQQVVDELCLRHGVPLDRLQAF